MGILFELVNGMLLAVAFEFLMYVTGASILRVLSFGRIAFPIYGYSKFKAIKEESTKGYTAPSIVGIVFYILLIALIAILN
ncbi:hypothetical protein ACFO4O_09300 [Glaciecola siphonariae]|uniref:YggT family protein n=1 Tax=Glaciecola siphonariae TaxID=521012 RepID=A0ABV9LWX6_9ALTE